MASFTEMFHLLASKAGGAASNHVQFSQGDWLGDLSMVDSICSLKCMPTQQSRSFIVDSGPLFYLGIFNVQHHNCQAPAIPPWAFWFQTCSNLSLVGTRKFDNFDADWYLCQADRLWWETEASATLQRWTHHPHGWGGSAWPQRWTQREVQDISCNSFHEWTSFSRSCSLDKMNRDEFCIILLCAMTNGLHAIPIFFIFVGKR